jgi:geranylgeranyl pyrophosphate synthase/predicted secreted hydrolase
VDARARARTRATRAALADEGSDQTPHASFLTSSICAQDNGKKPSSRVVVWRTFAEFQALHAALAAEAEQLSAEVRCCAALRRAAAVCRPPVPLTRRAAPPSAHCAQLPRSGWLAGSGLVNRPDFVDVRRALLDNYLKTVVAHPQASASRSLAAFLEPDSRTDWPSAVGDIDLAVHDLPHESSQTEWWYLNTHFEDADGRKYSAFAAFFRVVKHTDKDMGKKLYAHALNWALTDVAGKRYVQEVVLDKDSPAVIKKQLDQGVIKDARLERAYREMLDRGSVPLPDRMFSPGRDAVVSRTALSVDLESAVLTKDAAGAYVLTCTKPDGSTGLELTFEPLKKPVRHGLNGVVKGHDGDDMFYYLIPRCAVRGHFTLDGVRRPVAAGATGWYDHEFGGKAPEDNSVPLMNYAWNWAAVQLDDGSELSAAVLVDPRSKPQRLMESRAIIIARDGSRTQPTDLEFTAWDGAAPWTSVRTFNSYPTHWRLRVPSAGVDLELRASFDDQEFMTLIARPGFWEGRVEVSGVARGARVAGVGYVERNGFQTLSELDSFFKAVGGETRKAVREVYPDVVTAQAAVALIATPDTPWYTDGVDLDVFRRGIVEPVRYISDQGGKSWRSYGALACMDVVGGDSRKYVRWLSMPEFMHVGSLIVDDIEDRSEKRRGAPCAHIKYGEPTAINAGTAAYFQGQQMLLVPGLTPPQLNAIYDYYFAALRAGHAGQALDIAGLGYLMDDVIARGDVALAESRMTAVHRLKTAVPAASLARMGALVGGGTPVQIEAIGRYYEAIGIAFQIMDDVLNLRGLYTGGADKVLGVELKTVGEDIMAGKVTFPVVKAIGLLPRDDMAALWAVIRACPQDRPTVAAVIAKLEACGAIEACVTQSMALVEDAYAALDPTIPDSFSKLMLRAFGFFVTEHK